MVYASNAKCVIQSKVALHQEGTFIFSQSETEMQDQDPTAQRYLPDSFRSSVGPFSRGCGISHVLRIQTHWVEGRAILKLLYRDTQRTITEKVQGPPLSSICSLCQHKNTTLTSN